MWFLADVIGLLSINVVPKNACNRFLRFMLSGRYRYEEKFEISYA